MSSPWLVSILHASSSNRSGAPTMQSREGRQLGQALDRVSYLFGSQRLALLIDHDDHMMGIGPIDAGVPHRLLPSMHNGSWKSVAFYNSARSTTRLTSL